MVVWWSSVFLGRKKQSFPERASGRLGVDAMRMGKSVSQTWKKWDDQYVLVVQGSHDLCLLFWHNYFNWTPFHF